MDRELSAMRRIKYKAFTIIELLVVLVIIGIFTTIAYPNVSSWVTGREVKKEVYAFVGEINEMKSKVTGGEYALAMVYFTTPNYQYANIEKYYMTRAQFAANYSGSNKYKYSCNPNNQTRSSAGTFTSQVTRHWPKNIHMCKQLGKLYFK